MGRAGHYFMSVQMRTPDKKTTTIDTAQRTSKKWREPRYALRIVIEVAGIDHTGRPFIELTKTEEVSEWGCRFSLSRELERHALVALRLVGTQEFCLTDAGPVMYMVARAKQTREGWLTGASKIQAESLWDLSTQATQQQEPPPARLDQNAEQYMAVDKMEDAELDALSYGAIQLDGTGKILKYNQRECELSSRDRTAVIGKNFFTDVAPCASVAKFYGRFIEALALKKLQETFDFEFSSWPVRQRVAVTMLYSSRTETVWIFAQPLQPENRG